MSNKVLIVDDDPYIIIAIRELLESEGFKVYAAESGEDCLKILNEDFSGVILLDVMMPGMDGWQTVDEIVKKGLHEDNIIYILSAKNEPKIKPENSKYVKEYLNKPFDPNELLNKVKNSLL